MSKLSTNLPLKVILTVPSAKIAEPVALAEIENLGSIAESLEGKLESIYKNQITQLSQAVIEKEEDKNKETPRRQK